MKKKSASQSAFFKLRVLVAVFLCFARNHARALCIWQSLARSPDRSAHNPQPLIRAQYRGVMPVVKFDISPPLRSMKPLLQRDARCARTKSKARFRSDLSVRSFATLSCSECSARLEYQAPIITFDGNSNLCGCSPPDPNGAVGPNNVVTMANLHFQIFDKSGNSLFGPAANNTLWSGFGGPCQTENAGDPVVLYDQLADRWILTQFTCQRADVLRVCRGFTDQRSDWVLLSLCDLDRN